MPLTVLLFGWAICAVVISWTWERAWNQNVTDFRRLVTSAETAIVQRITVYTDALQAGAGFMRGMRNPSRVEWAEFAQTVGLDTRYSGIRGMGVIYPVRAEDLDAFVAAARADGAPGFTVHVPPGAGPSSAELGIITYIEPQNRNEPAVGLDVLCEPHRREAALAARDMGVPMLSRRIALVQDGASRPASLLYVPVYRPGTRPRTPEERRANLLAWIYAPLVIEELVQGAIGERSTRVQLDVFEGTFVDPDRLLYSSKPMPEGNPPYAVTTRVRLAGQDFTIGWRRGPAFFTAPIKPVLWTGAIGAVASVLLAGLIASIQATGSRARRLARDLTREMAATQRELETAMRLQRKVLDGTVHSIISATPDGTITVFNAGAERMLGYSRSEMIGRATPVMIHLDSELIGRAGELSRELGQHLEPGWETLVARARLGLVDEREWTYVRKNGSRLPVLLTVTALHNEAGDLTGFLGIAQDLTDRKLVEAASRQFDERLGRVLGHSECMVWEAMVTTTASGWNWDMSAFPSALYRRLGGGVPVGEVAVELWPQFKVPEQEEMDRRCRDALDRGLSGYAQEFRVPRGDGQTLWLRESVAITREAPGQFWLVGVAIDITEHKRMEAALADSERRLSDVFRSMGEGLVLQLMDGAIVECNDAASRILGLGREQLLARSTVDAGWLFVSEAGHQIELDDFPTTITARTGQAQRDVVMGIPREDRSVRWISVNTEPVRGADGVMRAVVASFTDITARKLAEEQLRKSLQDITNLKTALDAHAIVAVTDAQGVITYANDAFCRVSHYTREELLGKTHRLVNSGRHPPEFFRELWNTITAGRIWRGEICNRDKFGGIYWVDATIVPFLDETGHPVQYIAVRTDITERKRLEENLAVARDQALEASRLKSEFLATMSHEIRTPMNAIIGMGGLLVDTPLTAEQSDMLRIVNGAAESLLTIINDILDFSRIESGQLRLDSADFDLARIVEETVALLAPRAHEKHLELSYELAPAPECLLFGDGGRVRQVLLNLLGNAVKFTDAGEIVVRSAVTRQTAKIVQVKISVHDTGIGIAPEAQGRLFRPFVQVDGSATRRFGGTGLGLAITHQLVSAMGGEVGFESEPGRGSTFWAVLEFPRRGALPRETLPQEVVGRRLLLVDDSATSRAILLRQVAECGMIGEAVADAPAALARLRDPGSPRCDLVLIDSHMPGMTGVDLALEIRIDAALANLPLVLLSTAGSNVDVATSSAVGFSALLVKPVSGPKLARCVARVLTEPRLPAGTAEGAKPEHPPRGGLHVLLVEDNIANQRVASLLLQKLGHSVEVASNGHHALEHLAADSFDAVLMDCQMPLLDGYETTRWIRSRKLPGVDPKVPIIALTAYARPEDRSKCIEAGMNGYVSKPIRVAQLQEALAQISGRGGSDGKSSEAAPDAVLDLEVVETTRTLPGVRGKSLLPELVNLYLQDDAARIERIASLVRAKAGETLSEEVHAFGGNAAAFGGVEVRRVALELEDAARSGKWETVTERLVELRSSSERLRTAVRNLGIIT